MSRERPEHDKAGGDGPGQRRASSGEQQQRPEREVAIALKQVDQFRRVKLYPHTHISTMRPNRVDGADTQPSADGAMFLGLGHLILLV
jgi:hypothetical protein